MTYTISNECLRVSAYSLGAELRSLRKQAGGVEYLWQGAADSWKGRAPLLFPVIGRLKRGSYSFGGRTYAMGIHGFAKDAQFDATMRGETCLSFFLRDSPQTLELWPFEFELEIRYSLLGSALRKEHILRNRGASPLLYEVGGHDGYNVPLLPGEELGDYYLEFEGMDSIRTRCLDSQIMVTRESRTLELEDGRLRLDTSLFDGDSLILEEVAGRKVALANTRNAERIQVSFPDFAYLGLWSLAGRSSSGFICIEPWSSLPDCDYLGEELEDKEGVRHLAPGATETLAYTIELGAF